MWFGELADYRFYALERVQPEGRDPQTKQMLSRLSPQAIPRWHSALLAGVCFYFEQFAEAGFWGSGFRRRQHG
jgi:hypothetical protein